MTLTTPAGPSDGANPEMSDDLDSTVRLMAKIGRCMSPSFSPDGDRLAFVSDLGGVPQVWVVPAEGGWPEPVTAFEDPVTGMTWSPDGEWLAFSLAPGGGMNQQVYIVRPDGSDRRRLTDGGRENNRLGHWTHGGGALTLSSNRRRPDAIDGYLVDIRTGTARLVAENRGTGRITDVSRDGRYAAVYRMVHRGDDNLYLVDLVNGGETLLTPHEGPGSFADAHFSPDGRSVYLSSNKDRELTAFARVRLDADGRPGPIEALAAREDAELDGFALSEDGATAALLWNVAGRSELAFCELTTLRVTPGPELPAELASVPVFSRDSHMLALSVSGPAAPSDIWVLDHTSGALRQVTRSPHAGINLSALARPELLRFAAHDGLELSGWLYRPLHARGPGPIVLSFHGGPEGQERPRFDSTYQALLARGIAVFAPNVRGSSGFGKTFVNLDNGPLRVNGVRDINACVRCVIDAGVADPLRIGVMGGSYGGYMTMAALSQFPDSFAAGVNICGVVNFETFFAHTEPWMAAISKVEYGDPETQADMLRELSPIHRVDRVRAPTLVIHGANDTNVPAVEAEQVVESLSRRGVPVEYLLFPDEGHGVVKTANRICSTAAIVRWFVRHLKA